MNKTILFSPVGGTDPISQDNYYDGSLLHICRVYRPNEIILYMSQEIIEKQEKDDRYHKALHLLFEKQGRDEKEIIIKEIRRPGLLNVQEFDYFYNEFQTIIEDIRSTMDDSDVLILNVSSGTPAMKSGLLIIQNYSDRHAKIVQVLTPMKKMTDHTHDDGKNKKDVYELETLWELNEDNLDGFENRCREVNCPSFMRIKNEETIKKLVKAYDYQAALVIADSLPKEATDNYYQLLQMAYYRTLLDSKHVNGLINQSGYNCLPIRAKEYRDYIEYALNTFLRYKKGLYADFILSITPIVVNLFKLILKKQAGFDINDYTHEKKSGQREWDQGKLEGTKYLRILNDHYMKNERRKFKFGNVYSGTLYILIDHLCEDEKLVEKCSQIRGIEDRVRNVIAHQIVMVDENVIAKQTGGVTCTQIIDLIKSLFTYTDIPVKKEYWDSYERLNEEIFDRMGNEKKRDRENG